MEIKKNYKEIIFILLVTFVSILYYLISCEGLYTDVDFTFHINRIVGIASSLKSGQILDKIYPFFNYGYGYATPLFYCDILLYPFGILYLLGVNLYTCYVLMVIFYSFLTAFICFKCSKVVFGKYKLEYLCTILYVLANYRLYDLYYRAAFGEILAITFYPLIFLAVYKILVLKEDSYILLAFGFSFVVISHLISTLLYSVVFFFSIVFFVIVNRKDVEQIKKTFITIIKGTLLAVGMCLFFLLPMAEQMLSQEFCTKFISNIFSVKNTVISISGMLFPLSTRISLGPVILAIPLCYVCVKKSNTINYLLLVAVILFGFVLGVLKWPECLGVIQFLYRLYLVIYPILIVITCYVLSNFNSKIRNIIVIISTAFTLFNCGYYVCRLIGGEKTQYIENINNLQFYDYYDFNNFVDYNHAELGGAEYLPVSEYNDYKDGERSIIIDYGFFCDHSYDYVQDANGFTFSFDAESDGYATIPVTNYKGYVVTIDKTETQKCFGDETYKRVSFEIKKGKHNYNVRYKGTFIQKSSAIISVLTLLLALNRAKKYKFK